MEGEREGGPIDGGWMIKTGKREKGREKRET
jgi:hypothetical protein